MKILKLFQKLKRNLLKLQDDDGFECDDIELIEHWIKESLIRTGAFR